MDNHDELSKAVLDICVCGEIMTSVGKRLARVFGVALPDESPQEAEPVSREPENETPAVTLEDVRAVLTEKSVNGLTGDVKALIAEYGAKRLSDVPPEKFGELMRKAEALGHGG